MDEYWPVFISVTDLEASTHHMELNGSAINHEFRLHGRLEMPYTLEDVFLVLELETESAGKLLFHSEMGKLVPREPKYLSLNVPMTADLGSGHFQIHLFSQAAEVLRSNLNPEYRESVIDRMVEKRIASAKQATPKIFIGFSPQYPASLVKIKTSGQVVVTLRTGANGRVYDPTVKKASDAFEAPALAAAKMWRFLPQIKDGHPVETLANLPIEFRRPKINPGRNSDLILRR